MSRERSGGRAADELRPVTIEPGFMRTAAGSALIACGGTRVICTASVQESVPRWMAGKGRGWVTAEYGMLPASTGERKPRDVTRGRPDGRTVEIQRLIGRSLRGVADLERARRAHGLRRLRRARSRRRDALRRRSPAATSRSRWHAPARRQGQAVPLAADRERRRGLLRGRRRRPAARSRLPRGLQSGGGRQRRHDRRGGLVEVQATAERTPLSRTHLDELLVLAQSGIERLRAAQDAALR